MYLQTGDVLYFKIDSIPISRGYLTMKKIEMAPKLYLIEHLKDRR